MAIQHPDYSAFYVSLDGAVSAFNNFAKVTEKVSKKMKIPLPVNKEKDFVRLLKRYEEDYKKQYAIEWREIAATSEIAKIALAHRRTVDYFDEDDDFESFPVVSEWIEDNWATYEDEIRYLIARTFCPNLSAVLNLFSYYKPNLQSTLVKERIEPKKKRKAKQAPKPIREKTYISVSEAREKYGMFDEPNSMKKETSTMDRIKDVVKDNVDVMKETAATMAKADAGQVAIDNLKKLIFSKSGWEESTQTALKDNPVVDIIAAQILAVALCVPEFNHDSKVKKTTDMLADCLVVFSTAKVFKIVDIPGLFDKITKGIDFSKLSKLVSGEKED